MRAIGIRAQKALVTYCVVEETENEIIIESVASLIVPQALELPDRLSYVRNSFISIIKEFKVKNAGIRISEIYMPKKMDSFIERIYLEGVIQELFTSCSVEKYFSGRKNTIACLLNDRQEQVTQYFTGESTFLETPGWDNYSNEEREAIVSAIASLNLN